MHKFVILLVVLVVAAPAHVMAAKWETLEKCTLAQDPSNDGDSFRVTYKGKEYYFRLYFVDTPEKDNQFPDRVADQAAYFEISDKHAMQLGHDAAKFTKKELGKPFTVYTIWQDAKGGSWMKRQFAFIETKDGDDLGELLVENGLARPYGAQANHPKKAGGIPQMWQRLREAERRAQQKKLGGWQKGW